MRRPIIASRLLGNPIIEAVQDDSIADRLSKMEGASWIESPLATASLPVMAWIHGGGYTGLEVFQMVIPTARLRPVAGALIALVPMVFGVPWTTPQVVLAQSQVLFVSIVDADGEPVTDLTPEEMTIQWNGEDCETLELAPIDWPVRVTVFVDNGAGGRTAVPQIREGLRGLVAAIPEEVEVALATLAGRPRFVTRHTSDREDLARGIDLIAPDAGATATFMDALIEEAGRLHDDEERQYFPVIVMVASDGPDGSNGRQRRYDEALQRLVDNSATVHTRMLSSGNQGAIAAQVGSNVGEVTRGSHESLAAGSAFVTMLPELGQDIARKHRLVSHQYRVTYAPPDGASDQPAIAIGTTRPGLNLIATLDGNVP